MKNNNYILLSVILILFLTGCQNVKDGMTGKKRNTSDEFLVQKKNPLVLPPDFDDLPEPANNKKDTNKEEGNFDIKKILGQIPNKESNDSVADENNKSLKESILKKINKN